MIPSILQPPQTVLLSTNDPNCFLVSHASRVTLWIAMLVSRSVGQSTALVQSEISQQLYFVMKFDTGIYGPQKMNPNDVGYSVTFL